MNLQQKFKNKTFVVSFVTIIIAFIYQLLGLFGVVAPISESEVTQITLIVAELLVGLGVLINPNTPGIKD